MLTLSTVLREVIPIASAALDIAIPEKDYKNIKKDLDLMEALVKDLPATPMKNWVPGRWTARLPPAEGAELRALRTLLFELDTSMLFWQFA